MALVLTCGSRLGVLVAGEAVSVAKGGIVGMAVASGKAAAVT